MTSPLTSALVVLLAWWLSTGLILWRVRVADNAAAQGNARAHLASVLGGAPLLGFGIWAAQVSVAMPTIGGVYLGFAGALALWGWVELAFLSGVITGPNSKASPANLPPMARLSRAVTAVLWHEMALLGAMIWLVYVSAGQANHITAATFALLLGARSLAKINLFLGVPRINLHFIPRPIAHMASHFRLAPATTFLPLSIAVLGMICGLLLKSALGATLPHTALINTILATLAALALLEHLFMVLPLADAKLWAWMLPKPKPTIKTLKD